VQASFEAARVKSYAGTGGVGSVLVQRMIVAEYAGVLFTRDTNTGEKRTYGEYLEQAQGEQGGGESFHHEEERSYRPPYS